MTDSSPCASPADDCWLSEADRCRGQNAAILCNLPAQFLMMTVQGSLLMLYASDVLGFSPQQVSLVLGMVPLVNVALPLALLPLLESMRRRVLLMADFSVRLLVLAVLLAVPASAWGLWSFCGVLLVFALAQRLGQGVVWQPLLRGVLQQVPRIARKSVCCRSS